MKENMKTLLRTIKKQVLKKQKIAINGAFKFSKIACDWKARNRKRVPQTSSVRK